MSGRWPLVSLKELVREEREPVGASDGNGLPVFGVTNVAGVCQTGIEASADRAKYLRLRPGRFVYNPYRVNVGSLGLSSAEQDGVVSPAYVVFAPTGRLVPEYLLYFLKSARGSQLINFFGNRGTVRSALRFSDLCRIEIPLPPLEEQRRIAGAVDAVAAILGKAERLARIAGGEVDALPLSTARRAFSPAEGWTSATVEEVCEQIIDYRGRTPPISAGGIPHLTSANIRGGVITWSATKFVSESTYSAFMTRGLPRPGDVIFTMEAPLGEVAVVTDDRRFSLAQRLLLLRPRPGLLSGAYLARAMTSPQVRDEIRSKATATTVAGIASKRLKDICIPIAPLGQQQAIVSTLGELDSRMAQLRWELTRTATDFAALMPSVLDRAFSTVP